LPSNGSVPDAVSFTEARGDLGIDATSLVTQYEGICFELNVRID
jgi:hypothetical protein